MMLFTFLLRPGRDGSLPRPGGDGNGVALDREMLSRSMQAWAGLVGGQVEHVSTKVGPDGLYLGLFYRSMDGHYRTARYHHRVRDRRIATLALRRRNVATTRSLTQGSSPEKDLPGLLLLLGNGSNITAVRRSKNFH